MNKIPIKSLSQIVWRFSIFQSNFEMDDWQLCKKNQEKKIFFSRPWQNTSISNTVSFKSQLTTHTYKEITKAVKMLSFVLFVLTECDAQPVSNIKAIYRQGKYKLFYSLNFCLIEWGKFC